MAEIERGARLGRGTRVEAFAKVGRAKVGEGSLIRSHSVIYEGAKAGRRLKTGNGALLREDTVLGDDVVAGSHCLVLPGARVGSRVTLHSFVLVGEHVRIGDGTWIGPGAVLLNTLHPKAPSCRDKAAVDRKGAPVVGRDVRIGGNATINPYVRVGDGAIVASGAVVTRDVAAGTVVAGRPARAVKKTEDVICREHPGERVYVPK